MIQPVIKPVVKPIWQPAVSCIQPVVKPVVQTGLTTGWTNSGCSFNTVVKLVWQPIDNWLYSVNKHPTGCQTSWCFYTIQPVVKPVVQLVVSCKRGISLCCSISETRLTLECLWSGFCCLWVENDTVIVIVKDDCCRDFIHAICHRAIVQLQHINCWIFSQSASVSI